MKYDWHVLMSLRTHGINKLHFSRKLHMDTLRYVLLKYAAVELSLLVFYVTCNDISVIYVQAD